MLRSDERRSHGLRAALGPRQRRRGAARRWIGWQLRRVGYKARTSAKPDYIEFIPPVRSRTELAELSARVNWYLPAARRAQPVFVEGADRFGLFSGEDAPFMDPELVRDPPWAVTRPAGRPHVLVHDLGARTALPYARRLRRATLVDAHLAYGVEEEYFRVHGQLCDTQVPTPHESVSRLLGRVVPGGSAFVLATGPSSKEVEPAAVTEDVRITCNSAVKDAALLEALRPDVIAFGDPVFHYGPSRYAAEFRKDLLRAAATTEAIFLTTSSYVAPLVANVPEIADRLAVLPMRTDLGWGWPSRTVPAVRQTGNVLTNLMLPAAFALADEVVIAGCDGRDPGERYFWQHNPTAQYSDSLMQAAFEAHPAFFRDRDYADYYDEHVAQLEEFLATAEREGKSVSCATSSHMPPLLKRGAPAFAAATG